SFRSAPGSAIHVDPDLADSTPKNHPGRLFRGWSGQPGSGHSYRIWQMPVAGSCKFVEERSCILQIGGVEALGEPVVDGDEQIARLRTSLLVAPQQRQAGLRP